MKISKNISQARQEYPEMYHVINSNEVHSFDTLKEAEEDLQDAIEAELKFQTNFKPELVY